MKAQSLGHCFRSPRRAICLSCMHVLACMHGDVRESMYRMHRIPVVHATAYCMAQNFCRQGKYWKNLANLRSFIKKKIPWHCFALYSVCIGELKGRTAAQ